MTRIDKNSLLHTLFSRTSKAAEQGAASKSQSQSSVKYSDTQLNFQERVQIGLNAIDAASPNAPQKALEVYVNAALLQAFGTQLQNDPEYAHLLQDVLEALPASPDYPQFTQYVQTELNHVQQHKN